jgi:hypothetical protein
MSEVLDDEVWLDMLMTHRAFKEVYESVMSNLFTSSAKAMVYTARTSKWNVQLGTGEPSAAPHAEKKIKWLIRGMNPQSVTKSECVPMDANGSKQARRRFNKVLMASGLILKRTVTVFGINDCSEGVTVSLISNHDYLRALVPSKENKKVGTVSEVFFLRGPDIEAIAAGLTLRMMYDVPVPTGTSKYIEKLRQ